MAWFKVDDQLPDHRKARTLRKSHPQKRRDVAPLGLWTLAGAWSNDGFVPLEVLEDWDDDAEQHAERLVAAGLWHPTERDSEPGYVFHDWGDQNPVTDAFDPSSTGSFGNHVRWHEHRGVVDPDCEHCRPDDRGDVGATIGATIGANRPESPPESLPARPDPTRPDPSPPGPKTVSRKRSTDDSPSERFDEFWDTYGHKVGRKQAETAYRAALRKTGVTPDLLIAAAGSYIAWQRSEGKHPRYTKHARTWLHGEHWRDERPAREQPQTNVQAHLALVDELEAQERNAGTPTAGQIGGRA